MRNRRGYIHNSLERHVLKKIPIVSKNRTVRSVLSMLERGSKTYDSIDYIYVNNASGELVGVVSIKDLFNKPKNITIEKFMQTNLVTVSPETGTEKIADLALKHDLKAVPIVESGKLIGVIPSKKIISIINRALKEDIFHFAGIHKSHLDFESSLEISLFKIVRNRLPWLIIGLIGAIFMATYIGLFEETLAKHLIIASFVPAIVYMSDSVGTQIQTIFIRDLAVLGKGIDLKKYFFRQMTASVLIAIVIGLAMFSAISLLWKLPLIGFVISLAALLSLIVTSITAFLITLGIKRFRFDPALGSGPIATIISDITSVIIYFIVVVILL